MISVFPVRVDNKNAAPRQSEIEAPNSAVDTAHAGQERRQAAERRILRAQCN